jgi:hypothetical protein
MSVLGFLDPDTSDRFFNVSRFSGYSLFLNTLYSQWMEWTYLVCRALPFRQFFNVSWFNGYSLFLTHCGHSTSNELPVLFWSLTLPDSFSNISCVQELRLFLNTLWLQYVKITYLPFFFVWHFPTVFLMSVASLGYVCFWTHCGHSMLK